MTAYHGEKLGKNKYFDHGETLRNTLNARTGDYTHPMSLKAPVWWEGPVSLVDVYPTVPDPFLAPRNRGDPGPECWKLRNIVSKLIINYAKQLFCQFWVKAF